MYNKVLLAGFLIVSLSGCLSNQDKAYFEEIGAHRKALNETFFNAYTTPLDSINFKNFKGLKFYPPQPHTHDTTKPYKYFAKLHFKLNNQQYTLLALEPVIKKQGYENSLVIPFTDLTNGKETYHGGRYIDINKPTENTITLDFNLSYNPYCAYNNNYICPIPPKENNLPIAIPAGMKYDLDKK
jgi:uncharacterized protein (DUF1684 family)